MPRTSRRNLVSRRHALTKSQCECLDQVQAKLEEMGFRLTRSMMVNFDANRASMSPPHLMVERLSGKSRKRIPTILCTHCPFCGKKYRE